MPSLKDVVKAALEKKQAEQHAVNNKTSIDTGKSTPKSQVNSNKPAKKSAGRGR
jgi:hypothetical protein